MLLQGRDYNNKEMQFKKHLWPSRTHVGKSQRIVFVTLQAVIQLTRMHMNSKDDR